MSNAKGSESSLLSVPEVYDGLFESVPGDSSTDNVDTPPDTEAPEAAGDGSLDGTSEQTQPVKTKKRARVTVSAPSAVMEAAIEAAVSPVERRLLASSRQLAVVFVVPSPAWIAATDLHLRGLFGDQCRTFARDGSKSSRDNADVGNDEVAKHLGRGLRVFGIAMSMAILPASLVSAADFTIRLSAPDGALVRSAMRRCISGRIPATVDDGVVAGLDFDDLVAAMRGGSKAGEVVERLRSASESRARKSVSRRVPDLRTAVEYGAARTWGLNLAQDIADYKAGRLSWRDVDKGAVLFSPPGYGKSLYAQSLAKACGLPLVSTSVGELFATSSGHLDGVIKAIRRVFTQASALAPSILFLDELDGFPSRETLSDHGRDWWTPVLLDFILCLDNALNGQREGVVVLSATNRIGAVDPALMRPGRLERGIEIEALDLAGAVNILQYHLQDEVRDLDLTSLGQLLHGFTPAEIMGCVRAARRSARQAGRPVTRADIEAAALPKADIQIGTLTRIALHEAGHAVAAAVLETGTLQAVRVRSIGRSRGATLLDFGDDDLPTRAELDDRMTVVLSGRAAEQILLGAPSSGAEGDLEKASLILACLHASEGLGETLVHLCPPHRALELLSRDMDLRMRVERDLRSAETRALQLVDANREAVLAVSARLVAKRHISGADVRSIVEQAGQNIRPDATVERKPEC
jgi:cell division protease FtsH